MRTKTLWNLWVIFCTIGLTACDDEGIHFTQDEIIEGDIRTGKQVPLADNTLTVYTSMSGGVNIQGGKGDFTVQSANEEVATADVTNNSDGHSVSVTGHQVGSTVITVTDSEGNSAGFAVIVKNQEELWRTNFIYERSGESIHEGCFVTGVSPSDSAYIASEVLAKHTDYRFVFKSTFFPPSEVYRMLVYDVNGNELLDGVLNKPLITDDTTTTIKWSVYVWGEEKVMARYIFTVKDGQWIVKDLTEEYQSHYPSVTGVFLWIPVKRLSE